MSARPDYARIEDENKTWWGVGFDEGSYNRYVSYTKNESGSQLIGVMGVESVLINKLVEAAKGLFDTWHRGVFTVFERESLLGCFEGTTTEVCIDQIFHATDKPKARLVSDLGWSLAEVVDTRNRLSSFEEDWDAPGMELYDEL